MKNKKYEWFYLEFTDGSYIRATITPFGCLFVLIVIALAVAAILYI